MAKNEEGALKRTLGLWECVFFGVGSILGAGIYALIGKVAGEAGNVTWLAFLVSSVVAMLSAFAYAELAAMYPSAGGEYVYAKKAFGNRVGTLLGGIVALSGMVAGATVSIGFAGYFMQLVQVPPLPASLGIMVVLFLINIMGIRFSSVINILFTLIEVGGLALVVYAAWNFTGKVDYFELPPTGINGLLTASALSYFALIGLEKIVKLAEETTEPEKKIPRALFISGTIVMVVYTVVAIAAVGAVNWKELGASQSPLADIVKSGLGGTAGIIIVAVALFSTSNTILSDMISSSRILFNMGREIKPLQLFAKVSAKGKTPVNALLLVFTLMCVFALIGEIKTVALIANFFIFITFILVNLSLIVLRVRDKTTVRPYRVPLNIKNIPVISILALLLTGVLMGYTVYALASGKA